jgi:hypothetical protein
MDGIELGAGPRTLEMVDWVPAKPTGVLYIEMARYSSNDTAMTHTNPEKKETNRKVVVVAHVRVVVGIDWVIQTLREELVAVKLAENDHVLPLHSLYVMLVGHIHTSDLYGNRPGVYDHNQDNVFHLPAVEHYRY